MNKQKILFLVLCSVVWNVSAADPEQKRARILDLFGANNKQTAEKPSIFSIVARRNWQEKLEKNPRVVALKEQGEKKPIYAFLAETFSTRRDSGLVSEKEESLSYEQFIDKCTMAEALCNLVKSREKELVELFLKNGIDPNYPTQIIGNYDLPLTVAVKLGDFDIIKLLLKYGADPNETAGCSGSPLMRAVCSSHPNKKELAEFLLDNKARVDFIAYERSTALSDVALNGDLEMVKFLVSRGAHNRIQYQFSKPKKYVVEGKKEIIDSLNVILAEMQNEQDAEISEKIQVVKAHVEKEMDDPATFYKESKLICATDNVNARLKRDAFKLPSEQREAFYQVLIYMEKRMSSVVGCEGYPLDDKDYTPEDKERKQKSDAYCDVYLYVRDVALSKDSFLAPEERARLQAVKDYLEEKTKDQETLVIKEKDNEEE
jgi:hypothetical protein